MESKINWLKELDTKKKILAIGVVIALVIVLIAIKLFSPIVEQTSSNIELGSVVDLTRYLKYDTSKYWVEVINDDNIDTDKLGEYTITFLVTKLRNNKAVEKQFSFQVVDTVAPKVNIKKEEVYLIKGSDFKFKDMISYEDASGTCEVAYKGDLDTNTEGEYSIVITATDASGNIGESDEIKAIVVDRGKCDVRNAKFGDDMDTVERFENLEPCLKTDNDLVYETEFEGLNADLHYLFNSKGKLYEVFYYINEKDLSTNAYISYFNDFKKSLDKKYGKGKFVEQKGSLYKYCDNKGDALQLGEYVIHSTWQLKNMEVLMILGAQSYDIVFGVSYDSKVYKKN